MMERKKWCLAVLSAWWILNDVSALKGISGHFFNDENPTYHYETRFIDQVVDHYAYDDQASATFSQKYLVNESFWQPGGPIFFYTGNEGDIESFADNTGFVWETAEKMNALIVYAEHRYYGVSMPFGSSTYTDVSNLRYLSSDQAMADYAVLLRELQTAEGPVASGGSGRCGIGGCPVIAWGGSYGGMLAAWFRSKYPHIVAGAISASAPVLQFTDVTGPEVFSSIATRTFRRAAADLGQPTKQTCADVVGESWDATQRLLDAGGLSAVEAALGLCPLSSSDVSGQSPADTLRAVVWPWLETAWQYLAMVDYPYPANFLQPLPGYPVSEACHRISTSLFTGGGDAGGAPLDSLSQSDVQVAAAVRSGAGVFYNYSGQAGSCFNLSANALPGLGSYAGWDYQSCTEMVMPIGQLGGEQDMFYPMAWDLETTVKGCQASFGVTPRPLWAMTEYGSRLAAASNTVFSNGDLDPWSGGGVLTNVSATAVAIIIEGGAHHLDLRASNPADPATVVAARAEEQRHITLWVKEWNDAYNNNSNNRREEEEKQVGIAQRVVQE